MYWKSACLLDLPVASTVANSLLLESFCSRGGNRHHFCATVHIFCGGTKWKQTDNHTFCHATNAQMTEGSIQFDYFTVTHTCLFMAEELRQHGAGWALQAPGARVSWAWGAGLVPSSSGSICLTFTHTLYNTILLYLYVLCDLTERRQTPSQSQICSSSGLKYAVVLRKRYG